jgi:hypothetical protein
MQFSAAPDYQDPLPSARKRNVYNVYPFAFFGFAGAIWFFSTEIFIALDNPYVSMIQTESTSYTNVPYRRLVEFSPYAPEVVAFYIRVKRGTMQELASGPDWETYLSDCHAISGPSNAENQTVFGGVRADCQYEQKVTNVTFYKNFYW